MIAIDIVEVKEFPIYTQNDFMNSTTPYEYVYQFKDDRFTQNQVINRILLNARAVKFTNFKATYLEYEKKLKAQTNLIYADSTTQFEDQEMELNCGQWQADDRGISTFTPFGEVYACVHPIMPVLRLVNIDNNVEKLRIAYRKGKQWRSVIVDKKTLASNNSILSLADWGVAVTSENSKHLVKYIHDIENLNYDLIPEKNSVGRLGWIEDNGFSPYVDDLMFDGDANFKTFFESVQEHGSYTKWLETAREVRRGEISARLILAGSFASVLVKPLGGLPFFIHAWGGTEVGKTVGLMLAASVWANPEVGRFIHTFNSTAVGREKSAAFVNSMPLIMDELQIVKDKKEFDKDIYMLSEGAGRTRGNKSGGVDKTPTWSNCIITSGEMPITGTASGGGAVNRIIEIECLQRLFHNPRSVVDVIKKNYGFAGKQFVNILQEDSNMQEAEAVFKKHFAVLSENDTTEKQAMAAALILTADELITEWIFKDSRAITADEISKFLQSKSAVSVNQRAYEYICEYVVQNSNRFCGESKDLEVWGKLSLEDNQVWIVRREFDRICADAGFNSKAFLSWLRDNGKIEMNKKGFTKPKRINRIPCNCVVLSLESEENESETDLFIPDVE